MLDFDNIQDWGPRLTEELRRFLPESFHQQLADARPENVGSAYDFLYDLPSLPTIIDQALGWLAALEIAGYHGARLTDDELAAVQTAGLLPLNAKLRRERLVRVLSGHHRWDEVEAQLDEAIRRHSNREGQVHLMLSRHEVVDGDYRRNLSRGSEFDQNVADDLLGEEGIYLLSHYGEYRVLRFCMPGPQALNAANWLGGVEDARRRERIPSLVRQVLESWCVQQVRPNSPVQGRHCSMMFTETVSPDWIVGFSSFPSTLPR